MMHATRSRHTRQLLTGIAACAALLPALAQEPAHCGTDELRQRMIDADPTYLQREAAYDAEVRALLRNNTTLRGGEVVITVPVVFHVLHQRGEENISNEQLVDAIAILNADFSATNVDIGQVAPPFVDIVGNARIEFKLATKDAFGECTSGIERIRTVQTFIGESTSKARQWPRERYLNIWTAIDMYEPNVLAYALLPSGANGPAELYDGVMSRHDHIGSIGTSNFGDSRVISHEVGHYLGLPHTWGNGEVGTVCGDEGIEDTPITAGRFQCTPWQQSDDCEDGVPENVQNFMDYAGCSLMFTEGQVEWMRGTLGHVTAERNNLGTEQNLVLTGTAPGSEVTCAPLADFYAVVGTSLDNPVIPFSATTCTGTTVKFMDNSSRTFPTEWSWTFQDGTPSTSTERNPTVTFSSAGWKRVTLVAGNAQGSTSKTDDYAVYISDQDDAWSHGSYFEGFEESESLFPNIDANNDENHTAWDRFTHGAHSGSACARLNSGDRNPLSIINPTNRRDIDDLITPNLDLSPLESGQLTFWYAYSTMTTDLDTASERLEVTYSTNCGRTWSTFAAQAGLLDGTDLINNGTMPGPNTWSQWTINLPAAVVNSPTVRFRFRYHSSEFSNDLFIDDIQIMGAVGIEDLSDDHFLELHPNPTNEGFSVSAYGMDRFPTDVVLTDTQGAVVFQGVHRPSGRKSMQFNAAELGLATGLYLVRVSNEAGSATRKLVVQR